MLCFLVLKTSSFPYLLLISTTYLFHASLVLTQIWIVSFSLSYRLIGCFGPLVKNFMQLVNLPPIIERERYTTKSSPYDLFPLLLLLFFFGKSNIYFRWFIFIYALSLKIKPSAALSKYISFFTIVWMRMRSLSWWRLTLPDPENPGIQYQSLDPVERWNKREWGENIEKQHEQFCPFINISNISCTVFSTWNKEEGEGEGEGGGGKERNSRSMNI